MGKVFVNILKFTKKEITYELNVLIYERLN